MILKDLETVDKQLKKDPDESSASPVVVQISSQQPQPSNTPHCKLQRSIPVDLKFP
uniref:Uncharacterized protein n=1 Tax=Parascaris equorum TaxID=6256 RepID=A0A914R6L5_PAREQ